MSRTARFAALLAVILVLGVAGMAWGSNGDPLILGQTNRATNTTTLKGVLAVSGLLAQGAGVQNLDTDTINNHSWIYTWTGLTLVHQAGTIGRVTIQMGETCTSVPAPPSNPVDDQSTRMVFTSVVGFHSGVYVAGSDVSGGNLTICLNKPAPASVKVNWVSIDMDTLN